MRTKEGSYVAVEETRRAVGQIGQPESQEYVCVIRRLDGKPSIEERLTAAIRQPKTGWRGGRLPD